MTATLVFDTSPLSHFARADRLGTLRQIAINYRCTVTKAVLDEIAVGAQKYPELASADLTWLEAVPVDSLAALRLLFEYAKVLGSGSRDVGEAATLSLAELQGAIALIDEAAAKKAGEARGVTVHGTLWLVAEGYKAALLSESQTVDLVDQLRAAEAWFPCSGADFFSWAREKGLLPR